MRAIKYLFYRLYQWQVNCWNDNRVSINALVLVVVLLWMNLLTLVTIAESLYGSSFLLARLPGTVFRIGVLICMALMAAPLYFMLVYGRKYEGIVNEFKAESARQRRTRGLGVSLYVVFSLVLLFTAAVLHSKMTGG